MIVYRSQGIRPFACAEKPAALPARHVVSPSAEMIFRTVGWNRPHRAIYGTLVATASAATACSVMPRCSRHPRAAARAQPPDLRYGQPDQAVAAAYGRTHKSDQT